MKFRVPLWVTVVPLVAGVAGWWWLWQGYAAGLRTDVARVLAPGTAIGLAGFPYRLEADVANATLGSDGAAIRWQLHSPQLGVHRVPWQPERQVVTLVQPQAQIAVPGVPALAARLQAPSALASLHLEHGRIARLSVVWEKPAVRTALLSAPLGATELQTHFRDSPAPAEGGAPTADLVISGTGVRFGAGSPLGLDLRATIGAAAGFANWAQGGWLRVEGFALTDATGDVVRYRGSVRAAGGRMQLSGVVETVCPATLRAAVAGRVAAPEKRTRKVQRMAVAGEFPGAISLPPADTSVPPPPTRGQEPDCPRLR